MGGIPSLVLDGEKGKFVPVNSSYNMAYEIISLAKDVNRQNKYSEATKLHARKRHDPCNILAQLLQCYRFLLNE